MDTCSSSRYNINKRQPREAYRMNLKLKTVPGGGQPGAAGEAGQERGQEICSLLPSNHPPPEGGTHPETGRETVKSVPPVSFYRKSQVKSIRSFFKVERLSSTRSDRRIDMYLCFLRPRSVLLPHSLKSYMYQTKLNNVAASRIDTSVPYLVRVVASRTRSWSSHQRHTKQERGADTHVLLLVSQRIMSPRHTIR